MEWKFEAGDWVEVNVNDFPVKGGSQKPVWVKAQILVRVSYGVRPPAPAYMFRPEPKQGHGNIFLEVHVRKVGG